ncbi:MAG: hypothetical protein G01um10145_53 [Microgenomates group bacterium Gr01-1014_5]|nr:MAG: hypothetical protein G01um10145_53 [Microgenomates group bacterium Gr01-1014_5]
MSADQYILNILAKYNVDTSNGSPVITAAQAVYPILANWAGNQLVDVKFSGSHAKGTGVSGKTDTDLFISLKSNTSNTLKEIYNSLNSLMLGKGYNTKPQNVSIRINHNGIEIDLVPGVKYSDNSNYHWLYVKKSGRERTQTNIDKHIDIVTNSGRVNEIRAIKIWAYNHGLDLPSIYLELTVIEALSGRRIGNTADNVLHTLEFIRDRFLNLSIIDPSNSANIISNDLTDDEKRKISNQARISKAQGYWKDILW